MPIYEYQCTKCQHKIEALQKMSEKPLLDCPACGKPGLSKLISAASFRLKGSGWYETDFKTGTKKQLAESESVAPSGSKAEKPVGGKPDSPPSKADTEAAVSKEASNNKGKDSRKTPSTTPSS